MDKIRKYKAIRVRKCNKDKLSIGARILTNKERARKGSRQNLWSYAEQINKKKDWQTEKYDETGNITTAILKYENTPFKVKTVEKSYFFVSDKIFCTKLYCWDPGKKTVTHLQHQHFQKLT